MPVRKITPPSKPVEIFFSYAHEDEDLMNQVRRQLVVNERNGRILKWHDRKIPAGSRWRKEIDSALERAQIILLFVSPHFLDSNYCYEVEGEAALAREKAGKARVIPVILRPCAFEDAPFGELEALPTDAKPISLWDDIDAATLDVARGIMKVVAEFEKARASGRPAPRPRARRKAAKKATQLLPMPSLSADAQAALWATVARIRREPDTEFSGHLRAERTVRTLVVRRPDAVLTEVTTLVNVSKQTQGGCKFSLFTDSPSQFKDLGFKIVAKIDDIEVAPSVSVRAAEGGCKFNVILGFKGKIVKPGGRITLEYTARYPSSVALNDDYWVFPAEQMLPGARFEFCVMFPKEPVDVACYRVMPDDTREQIPFTGPLTERLQASSESLVAYRVAPEDPAGRMFVMTWRLENE